VAVTCPELPKEGQRRLDLWRWGKERRPTAQSGALLGLVHLIRRWLGLTWITACSWFSCPARLLFQPSKIVSSFTTYW
jgi:hypothetical protein